MQHNIPIDHQKLQKLIELWYREIYPDRPECAENFRGAVNVIWLYVKTVFEGRGEALRHHAAAHTFRWMIDEWREHEACSLEVFRSEVRDLAREANYELLTAREREECLKLIPSGGTPTDVNTDTLDFCDVFVKGTYVMEGPEPKFRRLRRLSANRINKAFRRQIFRPIPEERPKIEGFRNAVVFTATKSIEDLLEHQIISARKGVQERLRIVYAYFSKSKEGLEQLKKILGIDASADCRPNSTLNLIVGLDKRDVQYHIPNVSLRLSPLRKLKIAATGGGKLTGTLLLSLLRQRLLLGLVSGVFTLAVSVFRSVFSYMGARRTESDSVNRIRAEVTTVKGRGVISALVDEAAREELKEALLALHVLYSHALRSADREAHYLAIDRVRSTAEAIVRAIKKHHLYEFRYHVEDGIRVLLALGLCERRAEKDDAYRIAKLDPALIGAAREFAAQEAVKTIEGGETSAKMEAYLLRAYGESIAKLPVAASDE